MRLILNSGDAAASRVDDRLVEAIATAHCWWKEIVQNPNLRITDLAAKHGLTKPWATYMLRLAFLDPAIVEQVLSGKAPAHLTLETLRSPEAMPGLWSDQRAHHRAIVALHSVPAEFSPGTAEFGTGDRKRSR